jgi:DNA topoisomerase-1
MAARKNTAGDDEAPVTRRIVGRGAATRAAAKKTATRRKSAAKSARKSRRAVPNEVEDGNGAGSALVIVESPAKAKTIGKYLGRGYRVRATIGHVRDLPEKKLGIDLEKNFAPEYVTIAGKEKTLADLKSAAKDASAVYIATDPDREGEAIGWHVAESVKQKKTKTEAASPPVRRVLFREITKDAVREAMEHPRPIDMRLVDAQQARRVLDRLVGYKASPLLWRTVKKGLSAGRVQTVALRLIVERERDIKAFKPQEYWSIRARLEKDAQSFEARLHEIDEKKVELHNEAAAGAVVRDVQRLAREIARRENAGDSVFPVTNVKKRERRKNPSPPFTTSTLQQEAAKKLGFGSKRTMRLAQQLYEGVELGSEGAVGLITYMRTDSTRVAESAASQARDLVRREFGDDYLASGPRLYGADKRATNTQDAHEAIRPSDPSRRPEDLKRYLKDEHLKLYQLIWQRFMASQMASAVFDTTTLDFVLPEPSVSPNATPRFHFRSTGSVIKFPGFLALYREAREEGEGRALEDEQALPEVSLGEFVPMRELIPAQHFTEPPPRYSEASLVKELERLGIGRPSTYAQIISTLVDRRYTELQQRRFFPTPLGDSVERVMVKQFPDIFNVGFTSEMEEELDKIEEGELPWQRVLKDFYGPFESSLNDVRFDELIAEAHDLSALEKERCPKCGGKLMAKGGFFGPFVACENHPKNCDYTRPIKGERKPAELTPYKCHLCGNQMVVRHGRSGDFLGCSKFPKCRGTRSMPTGVRCPRDGGEIEERRSKKRGKAFYGCSNYPNCDFVVWDRPVPETCPECGYVGAEAKSSKTRGSYRKCVKCGNEWAVEEPAVEQAIAV